jgi:Family of unknown function (DUF5681)
MALTLRFARLLRQGKTTIAKFDVGRGRPPKHSRFRPGISGNPRGRPKRKATALGEIASEVFNATIEYREAGQRRKAPRRELTIKAFIEKALKGSVSAAETLLKIRSQRPNGAVAVQTIELNNWLPEYPGQTGAERSRQHTNEADLDTSEGQQSPDTCRKKA